MKQLALALMILSLAACSGTPRPAPGTPQRDCEDQADREPEVRALFLRAANTDPFSDLHKAAAARRAEAVRACLRARGLIPRGGVQRVED